jgi:glycosyltransferase involved in cell wall biosynthesis
MTSATPTACATIGVVAIGRNEGQRLRRCLESVLAQVAAVVYVDSGSTDRSVRMARDLGVEVVELDLAVPFTAARARNAGICRLKEIRPEVKFVQVVDGDCEIVDGWLEHARTTMETDPKAAIVCGRRRERERQASVYNTLCDMEWDTPIGEATACGGDALIRLDAYYAVGGYNVSLIAGEEPEMCFRLRRAGWRILRVDRDMTLHDAQMTRFAQWWTRAVRCGHAYAEGRAMHGDTRQHYRVHEMRSIIEWAMLLPLLAFGLAWFTWGASLSLLGGYVLLWDRVRRQRMESGDGREDAALYARYCVLAKFAQLIGAGRYWWNRLQGRTSAIIEYKNADADSVVGEERRAGSGRMSILYVGGTLPARSETFVYREVLALRDLGVEVRVATVHPPQRELGDDRVDALAGEVIEIYGPGPWKLLADALMECVAHPIRTMSAAACGTRDAVCGRGVPLKRRPKVLWQCVAGLALARRVRGLGIQHIHAHMAHVPTTIAMYCAHRLGISFSFTGHAVDLFREGTLLKSKLRRASFAACISEWHRWRMTGCPSCAAAWMWTRSHRRRIRAAMAR